MANILFDKRKEKGVSREDMARDLRIPARMLLRYEKGQSIPSVVRAKVLAKYLGISLDQVAKNFKK